MKNFRYILLFFVSLILVSCGGQTTNETASGHRLQIVTTIASLYSMTVNVAGEYADVTNLVPIGSSEHTYQARPSDIALLSRADLVIKNGVQLELFLDPLLNSSEHTGRVIVDTSSGITLLTGGEHHHEDMDEGQLGNVPPEALTKGDPHIWLSIENAKIQVKNIEQALSLSDPLHSEIFKSNADSYIAHLTSLEAELKTKIASVQKRPYILFHDGFQYFEKEFGLHSSGVVEEFPGKEPSVEYMKNLYDIITRDHVQIAFTEPQFSPKVIEQLKTRFQMVTAELDTIGTSLSKEGYEDLMRTNVAAFMNAFSK